MAAPDRVPATSITVANVGGDILAYVDNGTFKGDAKHVEAKGVSDIARYPWPVDTGWDLEFDLFAGSHSLQLLKIGTSVSVTFVMGGTSYSGTGLVASGSHGGHNSDLLKQKLMVIGQGDCTIA
jgi:hypothetical protein